MKVSNNAEIFCDVKRINDSPVLDFYLNTGGKQIFLFQQKFRKSTYNYYKNGCRLADAVSYKKAHNDAAIMNVIKRLEITLPYIEKEYNITIQKQTKSSNYKKRLIA